MEQCLGFVSDIMKDFCHGCGRELGEDDTVCPECGRVTEKGLETGVKTFSKPQSPTLKINPMMAVVAVTILLCVASAGMSLMKDNNGVNNPYHLEYQWKISGTQFDYVLDIAKDDYTHMMKSDIDRKGSMSSAMYLEEIDGKKKIVNGVADYIVVDDYIKKVASDLKKMCDDYNKKDINNMTYVQFISCFVQAAIDYKLDEDTKSQTEYWKYPLETLYDKCGDCEDGAILLAALLDAAGYNAGIYLLPGHCVAAVSAKSIEKVDGKPAATYYYSKFHDARYQDYYPIETAFGRGASIDEVGHMSSNYSGVLFHLYTGYSGAYFYSSPTEDVSPVSL